jgi:hypothetical protein
VNFVHNSWARKTAQTGLVAVGAVLVAGTGTAHADGPDTTTQDNIGAVSGSQVIAPIQAPINACGIAVAAGGTADAGCDGGAETDYSGAGHLTSQDNVGLGNGNQLFAPIQAPVNVCGNAIAVIGTASASCDGGSEAEVPGNDRHEGHDSHKEITSAEAAGADLDEGALPVPGLETVGGLDTVSGVVSGAPAVGGLAGGLVGNTTSEGVADTATDAVAGVTQLAGAGIL